MHLSMCTRPAYCSITVQCSAVVVHKYFTAVRAVARMQPDQEKPLHCCSFFIGSEVKCTTVQHTKFKDSSLNSIILPNTEVLCTLLHYNALNGSTVTAWKCSALHFRSLHYYEVQCTTVPYTTLQYHTFHFIAV